MADQHQDHPDQPAPGSNPHGAAPGCPRTVRHSTEHAERVYRLVDDGAGSGQPVYRDPTSGQPRLPTGRVFVRFAPGVAAASRHSALQQAGYRIEEVPVYAPQAAWVQATDGGTAQALAGIQRLERLPDVENVEPQWLAARAAK